MRHRSRWLLALLGLAALAATAVVSPAAYRQARVRWLASRAFGADAKERWLARRELLEIPDQRPRVIAATVAEVASADLVVLDVRGTMSEGGAGPESWRVHEALRGAPGATVRIERAPWQRWLWSAPSDPRTGVLCGLFWAGTEAERCVAALGPYNGPAPNAREVLLLAPLDPVGETLRLIRERLGH